MAVTWQNKKKQTKKHVLPQKWIVIHNYFIVQKLSSKYCFKTYWVLLIVKREVTYFLETASGHAAILSQVFGGKGRKFNRSVDNIYTKNLLITYIAMAGLFGIGKIEWNISD